MSLPRQPIPGAGPSILATALLLCALSLSVLLPSPAAAGGWTQPQDDYYLKVWGRALSGKGAYLGDGEVVDIEPFVDLQLNVYGEYGVTDTWTVLFFGVPSAYATALTDTFYVGPLGLGVRRALSTADLKLAAEFRYALEPGVGDDDLLAAPGEASGDVRYQPAIENQRGEVELQLGHGLSFGWVTLAAGMRFNSASGVDHAVLGGAQLGVSLGRWQLEVHLNTYQPLGEVVATNASGVGQTRYIGAGLGVGFRFGDGVGAVVAFDGASAQSNAASPSYQAGLELF